MLTKVIIGAAAIGFVMCMAAEFAVAGFVPIPLGFEYTVTTTVTPLDTHKYRFEYDILNVTDQIGTTWTGFDVFNLTIPAETQISSVVVPLSYRGSPGYWWYAVSATSDPLKKELYAAGAERASVYPIGGAAHISFIADNVQVGVADLFLTTYWDHNIPSKSYYTNSAGNYTTYQTTVPGPVAIPKPTCPLADLSKDCWVNLEDFALLAANYLRDDCTSPDWCGGADIDHTGAVNLADLAILTDEWLQIP